MIRPIQVNDYVSKQDEPGVFWKVAAVTAEIALLAAIGLPGFEYWPVADLMRAVPHDLDAELRQPSTHAAHAMGSGGR